MISKLKEIYKKEQFNPKVIGLFINPFYFSRKGLYKHVSELISNLNGRILDLGCGSKPYKQLCNYDEYIGVELDTPENRETRDPDCFYDGENVPYNDKYFDSVLFNQVLEHVPDQDLMLSEINRLLKIDGLLLLTVPFVWDEHEQPNDYVRFSSFGLKRIMNKNGFEVLELRKTVNNFGIVVQLFVAYIFKVLKTKSTAFNILINILVVSPIMIIGLLLSLILPKNNDLYLDNVVLCKKVNDLK